jgi:glycosyltransferase involved in cell wall biosynthesis
MKPELTIIIPVYNEEANLPRLKREMESFLCVATRKTKILFVNDGSEDNSLWIIKNICAENQDFQYISFDKNYGLSAAIKAGFDAVDTPLTGYIDADLQTAPEDFNILFEYVDDHELVTGIRANRKDSLVKNMSSKIANSIRRTFTKDGVEDTGCPLKIIHSSIAKRIPMFDGLHRFLPAMVLLQEGRVKQVPVRHFARVAGSSKFNFWNRLAGPLQDCFAFLWMKKKYLNYNIAARG